MANLTGNEKRRSKRKSIRNLGKKDTMSIVNKVYVLYAVSSLWTKNTHFALNILLNKENEVGVARKRKKSTSKSVCVLLAVVMSQLCRENALVKSITIISAS